MVLSPIQVQLIVLHVSWAETFISLCAPDKFFDGFLTPAFYSLC